MTEEWRAVLGAEGYYEVSDRGCVRSLSREVECSDGRRRWVPGRVRQLRPSTNGYVQVVISIEGVKSTRYVHHLVAEAFHGPRPEGLSDVCHNNGVRDDNRPSNLRYDTRSANLLDWREHGTNRNRNKTHCPHGHPYDERNTRLYKGSRFCITCKRISHAKEDIA